MKLSDEQMLSIARVLADPHRYDIVRRLAARSGDTPCSDVRECFDITAATLSHHMKELEAAGLVRSEKDGKFVNYSLQTRVLHAYLARLKSDLNPS